MLLGQHLSWIPRESGHSLSGKWCHCLTRGKLSLDASPNAESWLSFCKTIPKMFIFWKLRLATFGIVFSFPSLPIPVFFLYSCSVWYCSHHATVERMNSNKHVSVTNIMSAILVYYVGMNNFKNVIFGRVVRVYLWWLNTCVSLVLLQNDITPV